jgi:predicted nucleic acid-binding protein
MKALDTGVLLALLEGSGKAREVVRKLRGVEVATTEANLIELAYLAAGTRRVTAARLGALEKLRQRITVLPIDARGGREAVQLVPGRRRPLAPSVAAMVGALRAAGCEELITDDGASVPSDVGLRVRTVSV